MLKIGQSVLIVLLHLFVLALCLIVISLLLSLFPQEVWQRFDLYWVLGVIIFGLIALLTTFSRSFIRRGISQTASLFKQNSIAEFDESTTSSLMAKEQITMPSENKFYLNNPVIHNNHTTNVTNNNVQGGIIGSGTVHVHQHIEEKNAGLPIRQEDAEAVDFDESDMADVNELIEYSAKLMLGGVSRNTIKKIMRDANIKHERKKVGQAIRHYYPRKDGQSAIAQYVADKNY